MTHKVYELFVVILGVIANIVLIINALHHW
jgi:hypothetical protein